jgi:hypothetical protein
VYGSPLVVALTGWRCDSLGLCLLLYRQAQCGRVQGREGGADRAGARGAAGECGYAFPACLKHTRRAGYRGPAVSYIQRAFRLSLPVCLTPHSWEQVPQLDGYSGSGRHVYKDGSKYTGSYVDGKRHGRGVLRFKNGGYYEGQWAKDCYEGTGRYVSAGGVYEGMFCGGELCGRGVFRWANGDTYDGEWASNAADGVGTKTYADGRVEEGRWKADKFLGCPELEEDCETFTGFGRKRWTDGSTYVGEWLSGKRHGQGIFTFASGDVYEGGWAMDKFEGHGKYTSAEGTYEGHNRAGSWCGKGEFQWLDGRVYRGEFRDSAFNGHGKIRTRMGQCARESGKRTISSAATQRTTRTTTTMTMTTKRTQMHGVFQKVKA